MNLKQVKALIFNGKYYDSRKDKLKNIFGTNKKTKGGKLAPTRPFKTWLRATNKGITKEERESILLDLVKQANQMNAKAEADGISPDKYYTKMLNETGMGRTKMRSKAKEKVNDAKKMLSEKEPVASGKFSPEELEAREKSKDLKSVMEGMKKDAQEKEDRPYTRGNKQKPVPRKPRKKEIAGSRKAKADKEIMRKAKVNRLITGKPDVIDTMKGGNIQKRIRDEALSLLKNKSIPKNKMREMLNNLLEQTEMMAEDEEGTVRQSETRQQREDQQSMMAEDKDAPAQEDTMANFNKLNQMKEGVNMMMEDVNKDKFVNNINRIYQAENMKVEQEQKQSVRVLPVKQSRDITDPTSGENNIENVQMAVSDYKNEAGKGIHVDAVMRNPVTRNTDTLVTPPSGMVSREGGKLRSTSQMMLPPPYDAFAPRKSGTRPSEPREFESPREAGREGVQISEPEEGMAEPVELRGQTQQQGMGGRQRIGGRRPPQQQQQPPPSFIDTRVSDLSIPQEVERNADGGDGRLGITPSAVPQMDIQNETIKRNKKTIQQLRVECECFKNIYRDQIKTKKFKQLMNMDLKKKSLDEIRTIHKHYTEEVRDYYNSHRGLRVGVIVDPAILGLSVNALQGMVAPRVPSYTPAVDAGRRAEGFEQVGSELRRKPPTGQTPALSQTDVHYKLGGVRHATGKYDRDIESINSHIDLQEDKKISAFGRGSTRFGKPKRFKNNMYQVPKHTNIPEIRLKTK